MLLIFIKPRYFPNIFDILKLSNEKDIHLLEEMTLQQLNIVTCVTENYATL